MSVHDHMCTWVSKQSTKKMEQNKHKKNRRHYVTCPLKDPQTHPACEASGRISLHYYILLLLYTALVLSGTMRTILLGSST